MYSAWMKRTFGVDPLVHVNTPGNYPNLATIACFGASGATAGSFISLVACVYARKRLGKQSLTYHKGPFELTKLSAQVSVLMADRASSSVADATSRSPLAASYQNKGTFQTARLIVKHRGISGLYSGFGLHLCKVFCSVDYLKLTEAVREFIGTGVYFMTYESGKQLLLTSRGDQTTTSPLAAMAAGGLCGIVSWAVIYPIDSAKSIYQRNCLTHQKGDIVQAPKIHFSKRMYRGIGVSMARSCVLNAIFFSAFENVKNHINGLEDVIS